MYGMTVGELRELLDGFSDNTVVMVNSEWKSAAQYVHSDVWHNDKKAVVIEGT